MAEILLEPSSLSKIIPLSFDLNDTNASNAAQLMTKRQFNTADTDAWFGVSLEGFVDTPGSFDITLFNLNDKAVFNHTGKPFTTNPFYYKLDSESDETKNEIRHAGRWIGQIVVTLANGNSATRKFIFDIEGHILDGADVQTILLEDYNALIATINTSKDLLAQYNVDYAALIADVTTAEGVREQAEIDRAAVFAALVDSEMIAQNVETKLTEKELTYAPRLLSAEQQLAENTVLRPFSTRTKYQESKPIITFIDDDARIEAYTILREIALEKGFKFNSAVYGKPLQNGEADTMTVTQLLTLQAEGNEILSHGWVRNAELGLLDPSLYHREFGDSKLYLKSLGLDVNSFVYQGGSYNDEVLNTIPYYYDSAFTVESAINKQSGKPLDMYKIKRPSLDDSDLATAKGYVDSLVADGGWLVFTSHFFYAQWATPEKQQELRDLIDYINLNGIDIVTVKEGLEIHGNIIDYGKLTSNYLKVDKQGRIFSKYFGGKANPANSVFVDTLPSFFAENSMNITLHNGATTATGFPVSNLGTLVTIKGLANLVEQTWYPYLTNNTKVYCYKRTNKYPNYNVEWNDWVQSKLVIPVLEFEINSQDPNLATYPLSSPGKLLKSDIVGNGYYTEDYDLHNSPKKYKRYRKTDGTLSEWREYCFKKKKDFSTVISSLAAGSMLEITFDISDLTLTTSDMTVLNWASAPPAGLIWSYYHNGTNIVLRLYNAGSTTVISQTIYIRTMALINT